MSAAPRRRRETSDEFDDRLAMEVYGEAGKEKRRKKSDLDWLVKAGPAAVLQWLVGEIPRDSVQRARSRLEALLEKVEDEVPNATGAIALMKDILAQLEATPDPRPWQTTPGDLLEVTVATWEKVGEWRSEEDADRFL